MDSGTARVGCRIEQDVEFLRRARTVVAAHGVAADDEIANLSAGERRQEIDEVQRQVRRVLLHTIRCQRHPLTAGGRS